MSRSFTTVIKIAGKAGIFADPIYPELKYEYLVSGGVEPKPDTTCVVALFVVGAGCKSVGVLGADIKRAGSLNDRDHIFGTEYSVDDGERGFIGSFTGRYGREYQMDVYHTEPPAITCKADITVTGGW